MLSSARAKCWSCHGSQLGIWAHPGSGEAAIFISMAWPVKKQETYIIQYTSLNSIILLFKIQNHDVWAISRAWVHNVIRLLPLPSSSQLYPVALAPLNGMQSPKAQLRPWIKFWMKRLNSCAENHHPTMHNSWCAQRDRIELPCPKSPLTDNSEFDRISWCYTCISPLCQNVLSAH